MKSNAFKKTIGTLILTMIACLGLLATLLFSGCSVTQREVLNQKTAQERLFQSQPTPSDIRYSLDRYNLIKRAYWVLGEFDKANSVACTYTLDEEQVTITPPKGTVKLLSATGEVVAEYKVMGKVTSLTSYLTPDSQYYEVSSGTNTWIADVDGTFGDNPEGIFFFTTDNQYIEYTGSYIYTLAEP